LIKFGNITRSLAALAALLLSGAVAQNAHAQGDLVAWGGLYAESEAPAGSFTAVAVGNFSAVAIRADGTLASWGDDSGGGFVSNTPSGTFSAVAAGWAHAVAIDTDGHLHSWGGFDTVGELSNTPTGTFTAVAAGGYHSVAIRTDGTLVSWGVDASGEVSGTPTGSFTAVAAGGAHSVAIRSDGTLVSWGGDYLGQVSLTPSGTFKAVTAGYASSLAIRTDGTLAAWGPDFYGQVSATPNGSFSAISVGLEHSLAIRTDGTLMAWGDDLYGQLSSKPSGTFSAVAAGQHYSVAVRSSGANQAPVARDDKAVTLPGTAATLDVLTNDSDPDLDALIIVSSTNGALGTTSTDGSTVTYTPNNGTTTGLDSFTYTIEDSSGAPATATVFVNLGVTPHIASISPGTAMVGTSGPFLVSVSGSGFSMGAVVQVGGVSRPTIRVSDALLTYELSTADLAVVANLQITVVDPWLPALVSNAANFKVVSPKFRYSATALINGSGDVEIVLTIENRSTATALSVQVSPLTLDGVGPSAGLPVSFGSIGAGASVSRTVAFPGGSFIVGKKYNLDGSVSSAAFSENFREKVQIGP
jgi:hypothetical protein